MNKKDYIKRGFDNMKAIMNIQGRLKDLEKKSERNEAMDLFIHEDISSLETFTVKVTGVPDWTTLNIDNLTEFIKKDVAIQKFYEDRWVDLCKYLKSSIAYDVVEPTISTKYRYRIQEKKPIQITEDMALDVCTKLAEEAKYKSADFYHIEDIENHYGREVIIID